MTLIETLHAFAAQKATKEQVLRAALEHDGWQVPAEVYARGKEQVIARRVVIYGPKTSLPDGQLWVFSDDERARKAVESGRLGTFAADVSGPELFSNLEGFARLEVNIGSPKEETFFLELDDGFRAMLAVWSRAVVVEKKLARGPLEDDELHRALRAHDAYLVLGNPNNTIVTVPGQQGMGNGAAVFTAPDCAAALTGKLSPETAGQLRRVTLAGSHLFATILQAGVDGVVMNPFGPGPTRALPLELCRKIATAAPA
jgi:hypothetical protein